MTQKAYYDKKHRDVQFSVGDSVLLSTQNLKLKGIPHKLQRKFCGPYKILETIGNQAYRLRLPDTWRIHPVFHVSLLKQWRPSLVQQVPGEVELEDSDQPQYFRRRENSTVAVDFEDQAATPRVFSLMAGVSCRGCRMDPRIIFQRSRCPSSRY